MPYKHTIFGMSLKLENIIILNLFSRWKITVEIITVKLRWKIYCFVYLKKVSTIEIATSKQGAKGSISNSFFVQLGLKRKTRLLVSRRLPKCSDCLLMSIE